MIPDLSKVNRHKEVICKACHHVQPAKALNVAALVPFESFDLISGDKAPEFYVPYSRCQKCGESDGAMFTLS